MPYRPTKDAFLGKGDIDDCDRQSEDAAGYSIGAQTGTVQEKWVQDHLVDEGLTPADKVFSYERADQAAWTWATAASNSCSSTPSRRLRWPTRAA